MYDNYSHLIVLSDNAQIARDLHHLTGGYTKEDLLL